VTRAEFIEYLGRWARSLDLPLQVEGPLAGLPLALDGALHLADAMLAFGQPAPDVDEIRAWYADASSGFQIPAAIQAYASLSGLCEADLNSLDEGQLLLFAVRCSNWATLARSQWHKRREE
jgi:hypothetical protein